MTTGRINQVAAFSTTGREPFRTPSRPDPAAEAARVESVKLKAFVFLLGAGLPTIDSKERKCSKQPASFPSWPVLSTQPERTDVAKLVFQIERSFR